MKDTLTALVLEMGARAPVALAVAVRAGDPVRAADLAARVVLAGHVVAEDGEEDAAAVLTDAGSAAGPEHRVLRVGAGTALADLSPQQLDAALRAVAVGLRVSLPAAGGEEVPALTPREAEILGCIGEGLSNKAAARRLGISAHTVKFHLEAVFAKLGAASRTDAVARAIRAGLLHV